MADPINLTDDTLERALADGKPLFILFTNGDGLRGDFRVAYNKAASEDTRFMYARINPEQNPRAAERFAVGDRPTLVGLYCGEELVRRARPWGSDLPLAQETMEAAVREREPQLLDTPAPAAEEENKVTVVVDAPVIVTDATFEEEVLNSDMTVLVDFWAPWCGPCRMVAPVLDKLAKEFAGQIKIAKVNVDENPGLSQAFQIRSIPNLMIVKSRTIIFNQPGALPEPTLRDLVRQAIAVEVPPRPAPDAAPAPAETEATQ